MDNLIIKNFIDYWDNTIKEWADSGGIIPESEKEWFEGNTKLCEWSKLMPEPYWGNPTNCSAVILHFNPACSQKIDESCDGYIDNKHDSRTSCGLMSEKYSVIAEEFPILNKPLNCPYKCFGGVKWWQIREDWIKRLIPNSNKKPFGLEFCGWHSPNWHDINFTDKCKDYVNDRVIPVFKEAIKNSDLEIIVLCIGKEIGDFLINYPTHKSTWSVVNNNKEINKILTQIKNNRIYRILKSNDGLFVLNTYGGRLNPPAKEFENIERQLINEIKKLKAN